VWKYLVGGWVSAVSRLYPSSASSTHEQGPLNQRASLAYLHNRRADGQSRKGS
jgi:hypothetical protein